MTPSREDFERWRDDVVTRWVFKACQASSDAQEATWKRTSWDNGSTNQLLLTELRTRADAYRALFETDYLGWLEANGEEPNDKS